MIRYDVKFKIKNVRLEKDWNKEKVNFLLDFDLNVGDKIVLDLAGWSMSLKEDFGSLVFHIIEIKTLNKGRKTEKIKITVQPDK